MKKILTLALILIASITLVACGGSSDEPTDAEKVEEAKTSLLLDGLDQVKANMNLPTAGRNSTTITWESSHPSVISNTGEVTRPAEGEGNVDVTLTATITLNDESATREFVAVVMEEEPSSGFDTVAELHEMSSKDDVVEFQGIVSSIFNGGYFLTDGTNAIGVYGQIAETVNVGDEIYVKGSYASYNTLFQIADITLEEIISTGNPVDMPVTNKTIAEISNMDSSDKLIHGQHYNIIGTVELRGDYNNVWVFTGDQDVVIYYESPAASIDALEAVVGETIEFEMIYYTDHATDGVRAVFQGGASDITLSDDFSDEQNARLAASYLSIGELETITDFTLPSTIDGYDDATVTWSTSDASVVASDGTISRDEEESLEATLTATITVGSGSYDMEFHIVVLSIASENATPVAVVDVLAGTVGEGYLVEGVVSAVNATDGFFIQDADGTAIYIDDLFDGIEEGDHVVLTGELDLYDSYDNGKYSLIDVTLEEDNNGDNAITILTDLSATEILDAFIEDKSTSNKVYTTDLTFDKVDSYGYAFFDADTAGDMQITFYYEEVAPFLAEAEEGLVLENVTFAVQDLHYGNLRVVSVALNESAQYAHLVEKDIEVTVTGIVIFVQDYDGSFYLQDADGTTIYVDDYSNSLGTDDEGLEDFKGLVSVGDNVTVVGDKGFYQVPLVDTLSSLTVNSSENAPTETVHDVADPVDLRTAPNSMNFGQQFKFYSVQVLEVSDYNLVFYINEAFEHEMVIEIEESVDLSELGIVEGDIITFTATLYRSGGWYDEADSKYYFSITDVEDIVFFEETADYAHMMINDIEVTVTGVVTFVQDYDGSFFVEDADGTTIYVDDYSHSLGDWPTVAVGDEVTVVGDKGFYKVPLIDTVSELTINSSGNALTDTVHVVTDLAELRNNPDSMNFGQRFTFTDVTVLEVTDYSIVFFSNEDFEQEMIIEFSESVDLSSLTVAADDVITFTATLYRSGDWFDEDESTYYFGVTDLADITVAE